MFGKIWDWPESPIRAHRSCRSLVHSCFSFQVICVIKGPQVGDHERRPHTAAVVPAGSGQPQIGGGGRQKVAVPPARARCESTGLSVICVSVCRENDSDCPPPPFKGGWIAHTWLCRSMVQKRTQATRLSCCWEHCCSYCCKKDDQVWYFSE